MNVPYLIWSSTKVHLGFSIFLTFKQVFNEWTPLTLPYSEEGKISAVTPGVGIQGEGFVLSDTKSFSRVTATYTTFNHTPDIYI
jgi:hypothetical protein